MQKFMAIVAVSLALAGCGGGSAPYDTLDDVEIAEDAPRAGMRADPEQQGGVLSGLFGSNRAAASASVADDATTEPATAAAPTGSDDEGAATPRPRGGGLFGFLRGAPDRPAAPADKQVQTAAKAPETGAAAAPTSNDSDGGLFGGLLSGGSGGGPRPGDVDYAQVGPGVTLPYGQMARLCGVSAARLGREVARYPERGRGFKIYDSAPGSTGLRSFFVTGFDDGCARQISAALALFATPESHEQLRYGPASKTLPYTETDEAYETLKSRECRVRRGQPCGGRIGQLNRSTAFITIYERFGGAGRWSNILLHDGEVLAKDVVSG